MDSSTKDNSHHNSHSEEANHSDTQDGELVAPNHVGGNKVSKLLYKLSGQPESYINKRDYVFGRTLGAGTFGIVRQARRYSTKQNVAVKILLKKALKGNDVQLQMLYDELSILQKLRHPNIVRFEDWFESKDKFYIVTQLATGGELFDRIIAKGHFTEEDAVKIVVQMLNAVEYMHSENIVHRDLKPENILYIDPSDDSPLVIADFGIAKELHNNDELIFKAAGSLGYVAPEVLTTNGHGKPCDIWSLGVITYTLLCGYSPFVAESVEGFLEEVARDRYPVKFHEQYWSKISTEARRFILRALEINPQYRPTASELLCDPWITSKSNYTHDLLPHVKKQFDARKKFRDVVEIVKLNNRIDKLRNMYCEGSEEEEDLQGNDLSPHKSLLDSLKDLSLQQPDRAASTPGTSSSQSHDELKSSLTQSAFAQLVKAATTNTDKVLNYKDPLAAKSEEAEAEAEKREAAKAKSDLKK
ncbi:hypothetical protein ZYGR_0P02220 [Zygosaccharomyces rouxii]|uniref:calcium/calmodulin-dependent protein kinase n=1 Tax=Zygosaccharomyces rouxii TaxID=4956 RepID=A0A1Q3A1N1_ZYGRO|nr:hypothetical protein ZYGR_0P02220 [Zygosaccharomyces rouxii]